MIAKSLGLTVVGLCCFLATSIISYAPSASLTSVQLKKAWAEDGTAEGVTKKEAQAAKWAAKKEAQAAKWAAKKEAQAAKRAAKKNAGGAVDQAAGTLTQQEDEKASTAPTNTNGRLRLFDPVVWPCATSDDDGSVRIDKKHGTEHLVHTGAYVTACKFFAKATITSAAVSQSPWAVNNGVVTVNFKVEDEDGKPVVGVSTSSPSRVRFTIAKLVPASGNISFNQWVPYILRSRTGQAGYPNDGVAVDQGTTDSGGTLIDYRDGSYSYKFGTNIANVVTPAPPHTPVPLERNLTHRIAIMIGGNSGGATANAVFDFVPDGSPVTETRDIVQSTACYACHWEKQLPDHGGDRFTVEVCVTCHNPGTTDANSGNTMDFKVMLHKIHVGGELASIEETVEDVGVANVWQLTDEQRFDFYFIGNRNRTYWKVEFPAVIENCTKCHQGSGAQVDNWKNVPSRQACGSCHDTIDFATGENHPGFAQTNDNLCPACHPAEGEGLGESVTEAHNWLVKDQRNIPEFDVDLTVSPPNNGQYFVAGEAPVVTVKLTDVDTGLPVDYLTMTTQSNNAAEGCLKDGCPPRDNKFPGSGLFVHGPRARRVPVLTTPARVELLALNQAMYNLTAVTQNLDMTFDGGKDLYTSSSQLSTIMRANVSVDLKAAACTYANLATASPTEIMNCLNGNAAFAARGIAYIDEATGRLAIRSRNLGDFYSLQLAPSDANSAVFNNTTIQVMGGFTVSTPLAANTDPKVTRFADRIEYQLDPVDDLQPGTYMVGVEITDRGRPSTSNYKTPSVKKAYFQVKQAAEEKAIANNCDSCHQGPQGTGFVLDYYRHNKIFDHTAVDQCGQCHDYQSQSATGDPASSNGWSGSRPISKRVHSVHFGSSLNYPLLTVNYANGDPVNGRNWDIAFPQDVRNCETCHPDGETSGTWKTNPSRLPCSGCHDDDYATAHMISMTYDPTPANPWSGDEEPACKTCH